MKAWTCMDQPDAHGSFLQAGLDALADIAGVPMPVSRYACPICCAIGAPGWLTPATITEADRLSVQQEA